MVKTKEMTMVTNSVMSSVIQMEKKTEKMMEMMKAIQMARHLVTSLEMSKAKKMDFLMAK